MSTVPSDLRQEYGVPTPVTAKWPKPKNEDEFEDIATDFLRIRWNDPHAARNGRRGQGQNGVDVVGHPPGTTKPAGGQSKNTESPTLAMVTAEVEKAKGFSGGLSEFLVVTTADRDARLQTAVWEHYAKNPAPFRVELIFWSDVTADLAGHDRLVAKYWKGFSGGQSPSEQAPLARPPSRIDRAGVRENETAEWQCELALSPKDTASLDASELATVCETLARDGALGPIPPVLMRKTPTESDSKLIWRLDHREYSNAIKKWQLEIGSGGAIAFRWAEFITGTNLFLPVVPFVEGVLWPLVFHRIALQRLSKHLIEGRTTNILARLTVHGSGPILLNDAVPFTIPATQLAPESAPDWSVDLEGNNAAQGLDFGFRLLNRALAKFRLDQRGPAFLQEHHSSAFLRIDEAKLLSLYAAWANIS